MRSETIVFNGIRFRRYPDAASWAERAYYVPGIADREAGVGRLHEEIWESVHGPIPPGYHVHHQDFDSLNNDPSNLVCVEEHEHQLLHIERSRERGNSPDQLAHLARIQPLAAEWHRSEEGREWHSQHAKASYAKRESVERTCEQCGTPFQSISRREDDRFCSNPCKSAHRRASGVDNETRVCAGCRQPFTINRYAKARSCSRRCAWAVRRAAPQAGLQPDG